MLEKLGVYLRISAKEKENEILIKDMTRMQEGTYVMRCAIWHHLYNFKNVKNTHEGVLLLVKLQTKASNFIKINFPSWVFYTFFKLYKWKQIVPWIFFEGRSINGSKMQNFLN